MRKCGLGAEDCFILWTFPTVCGYSVARCKDIQKQFMFTFYFIFRFMANLKPFHHEHKRVLVKIFLQLNSSKFKHKSVLAYFNAWRWKGNVWKVIPRLKAKIGDSSCYIVDEILVTCSCVSTNKQKAISAFIWCKLKTISPVNRMRAVVPPRY